MTTDNDGAVDTASAGTDLPADTSSQDTSTNTEATTPAAEDSVSRAELQRAIRQRDKAKAERGELSKQLESLQSQVEELTATDASKTAELFRSKFEAAEKARAEALGLLESERKARKEDGLFANVRAHSSAEEFVVRAAFDKLLALGALDDALDEGDADAALKALKKQAPSLFTEPQAPPAQSNPNSGAVPPTSTRTVPTREEQARKSEEEVMRVQGRRVKNLLAG